MEYQKSKSHSPQMPILLEKMVHPSSSSASDSLLEVEPSSTLWRGLPTIKMVGVA